VYQPRMREETILLCDNTPSYMARTFKFLAAARPDRLNKKRRSDDSVVLLFLDERLRAQRYLHTGAQIALFIIALVLISHAAV